MVLLGTQCFAAAASSKPRSLKDSRPIIRVLQVASPKNKKGKNVGSIKWPKAKNCKSWGKYY